MRVGTNVADSVAEEGQMSIAKRLLAEFIGTFWLVLIGCGTAVLGARFPEIGAGILGVAWAFGLTLLAFAFFVGPISGCHINPAVTFGLWAGRRFAGRDVIPYVVVQVLGAIGAAAVLHAIAVGQPGFSLSSGFAANGYGAHSPGGYSLTACIVCEVVMTFMFVLVVLGANDPWSPKDFAPIPIGIGLMLANLFAIPVTNASINPARSTGQAIFVGGWATHQLWMFWAAPILGGLLAGLMHSALTPRDQAT